MKKIKLKITSKEFYEALERGNKERWKNSLVIFKPSKKDIKMWKDLLDTSKNPFKIGETYLCLGEIKNMQEHFIYVDGNGKVYWGYHNDFFEILKED